MNHPKYEATRRAIELLAGDMSVDREATRDALENLAADVAGMLDAMREEDLEND